MKIIFCSRRISQLTYLAANLLSSYDLNLSFKQQYALLKKEQDFFPGTLQWIKEDKQGNQIYALGLNRSKKIILQALMGYSFIFQRQEGFLVFDLWRFENSYLKCSWSFKRLGAISVAEKLNELGLKKAFPVLKKEIQHLREWLS